MLWAAAAVGGEGWAAGLGADFHAGSLGCGAAQVAVVARERELSVRGAAVKGTGHQNRLDAFAREHPVCARLALTPPSEVKPWQGRQKLAAIRCGVCAQRPASLPGRVGDEKTGSFIASRTRFWVY